MNPIRLSARILALLILQATAAHADRPDALAVPDQTLVASVHAQGAQVYECKADAAGKLAWQFREPIATLLEEGKTVGRHYAGPTWALDDGSAVVAKLAGRAAAATTNDIPLLKLEVTSRQGSGRLTDVTTILRLNTRGGVAQGPCNEAGAFLSVPYAADYAFYRKARWSLAPGTTRNDERRDQAKN